MRFFTILAALLAPLCVQAIVAFTNNAYNNITPGVPFTLTWSGDGTPATIALLTGPKTMLTKVSTEAVSGSEYLWTPSGTLQRNFYALSITQSGVTNYSPQFLITGSSVPTSTNKPVSPPFTPPPPLSSTAVQAGATGYRPHFPTYTVIRQFNTSSTASNAHVRYTGTISSDARVAVRTSFGLSSTGVSGQRTAIATLDQSSFTGGAMRLGGFRLGYLVAAVFAGAVLAGWAF